MKKIYSIICLLCFASVLLYAQTECTTIAQLKALDNGTECLYTGIATTTYYDAYNGIIMQDATGAILLQNYNLTASNTKRVKVGMEITNVTGTFKLTDASYMTRIEMKSKQVDLIEIKSETATFSVETIDFDDYVKSLDNYWGKPVRFENVNIRPIEGTSNYEIYSLETADKLTVSFMNSLGMIVPARADLEGFLSADYSGKIFRVGSADVVTPYAYKTISNLRNAITEVVEKEFELTDTFVVTNVIQNAEGKIVYIQDRVLSQNPANYAVRVLLPTASDVDDVKVGNQVVGLYGKLVPYVNGDKQQSATFIQNETHKVNVVSFVGKAKILGKYIYELKDNGMQNAYLYDAALICFSNGKVTANADGTYSYVIDNENGNGKQSVALKMAGVDDLSSYVNKLCPVQGVIDIAATYPENNMTLIMRSDKDFLEPIIEFETIADIINAGAPVATNTEYKLLNSALVTCKFVKTQGVPIYFVIVEDSAAAIVLSFGEKDFPTISVGDSICGIRGVYDARSRTNILNIDVDQRKDITIKNRKNEIIGIETTIKDIVENKDLYENRIVSVKEIINNYTEDGDVKIGYFEQDGYRLQYTTGVNSGDFVYYDYMNIVGIVDNCLIGEYFSIWPLSQDHIIDLGEAPEVSVDNIQINANIYSENNTLIIETIEGANITIFNMQGVCLYSNINANVVTVVDNIMDAMVIVKVDNIAYKVLINQ